MSLFLHQTPQVSLAQDREVVQALASNTTQKSFRDRA